MDVSFNQVGIKLETLNPNPRIELGEDRFFNFDKVTAAKITGAPDNATIFFKPHLEEDGKVRDEGFWEIVVSYEDVFASGYQITLNTQDEDGFCLGISDFFILEQCQGQGILKKMFPIIVDAARALSVKKIKLNAAKKKLTVGKNRHKIITVGHLVWPKFGLDGVLNLTKKQRESLPDALQSLKVERVQELWSSELWSSNAEKVEWWDDHLKNLDLFFDLDSPVFMGRLEKYLSLSTDLCKTS